MYAIIVNNMTTKMCQIDCLPRILWIVLRRKYFSSFVVYKLMTYENTNIIGMLLLWWWNGFVKPLQVLQSSNYVE